VLTNAGGTKGRCDRWQNKRKTKVLDIHPQALSKDLGGHWFGVYGTAPCPVCQPDRRRDQNALTISATEDGKLLIHCKKSSCGFSEILAALGHSNTDSQAYDTHRSLEAGAQRRTETLRKAAYALQIWNAALPISGSLAETYLRTRGITCGLPQTLRFHPSLWHGPSASNHPAMIAHVQGGDAFAIHRTWLASDGTAKAEIDRPKAMMGPTRGGSVHLTNDGSDSIIVSEGIETGLSIASFDCYFGNYCVAALSTSGLRSLRLPQIPGKLVIASDGDAPGRSAAIDLAQRAHALGWTVNFLDPPEGQDFNDVLMEMK